MVVEGSEIYFERRLRPLKIDRWKSGYGSENDHEQSKYCRDEEKIRKDTAIRIETTSGIKTFRRDERNAVRRARKKEATRTRKKGPKMEEGQERKQTSTTKEGRKQTSTSIRISILIIFGFLNSCSWLVVEAVSL